MIPRTDCRKAYLKLWQTIRLRAGGTDVALAAKTGIDQAVISRMIQGKRLPRRLGTLVKLAEACGADGTEIRVLMAITGSLQAHYDGDKVLAQYYWDMFTPLYPEDAFRNHLNSGRTIAANLLVDRGVCSSVSAPGLMCGIKDCTDPSEFMSKLLKAGARVLGDKASVIGDVRLNELTDCIETYRNLITLDLRWPWVRLKHSPRLRRGERRGQYKVYTCAELPNVQVTLINLDRNREISESRHDGIEFVFLCRGNGVFRSERLQPVALDVTGRRFIAHAADRRHSFTAGAEGAELVVVDYLRPQSDRIDRAILAAERRTSELIRRRRKAAASQEEAAG